MGTSSDADRYADLSLNLACPKCGSGGLIPLQQLDQMLFCRGCQSRFGVEPQGLVELPPDRHHVHVRSHLSGWKRHEAIIETRSTVLRNGLVDLGISLVVSGWGRSALVLVAMLVVGGGVAMRARAPTEKPPLEIPDSLDGRAKLFGEALFRRDMGLLTRLTDPARHRALRIWLAHGKGIPQPIEDKDVAIAAEIVSTAFASASADQADVRVRLTPTAAKPVLFDGHWAQQGAAWYFQPTRLRSPVVVKGPVQPYAKPTRR